MRSIPNSFLLVKPLVLAALVVLLAAPAVFAHKLGEGYAIISIHEGAIDGRFELRLQDIDQAIGIDANTDGKISDEELDAAIDRVWDYALSRFRISTGGAALPLSRETHSVLDQPVARYAQLYFKTPLITPTPKLIDFHYSLLFDNDERHRGFLILEYNHQTGIDQKANETEAISLIFSPGNEDQTLDTTLKPSRLREFIAYVGHGIWHIWIGIDHILFLVALVLPSTLLLGDDKRWQAVASFKPAFFRVVKIVTLFTVAHSITLCLAAAGIIGLESRWVESIIAASVLAAAVNNIYPFFKDWTWLVIFAFGLFHGMGFASVLGGLIAARGSMLTALVGFNIGVEIGQVVIILGVFPLLYALRNWRGYTPVVLRTGSGVIAVISLLWCIERVFELDSILGFI